jgi:hypothetical protein
MKVRMKDLLGKSDIFNILVILKEIKISFGIDNLYIILMTNNIII